MPTILTNAIALVTASWPALLALGALTTAINQFTQAVIAPKFPVVGKVVNTLTVDYAALLAEGAAIFGMGPRAAKKPSELPRA